MANWVGEMLARLERYSGYNLERRANGISVRCETANSFEVGISKSDDGFVVEFDGWHDTFEELADALNCFVFGLSGESRLEVVIRGQMECSWTVQHLEEGRWVDDSTTGMILIPFWRRQRIEHRRNALIPAIPAEPLQSTPAEG